MTTAVSYLSSSVVCLNKCVCLQQLDGYVSCQLQYIYLHARFVAASCIVRYGVHPVHAVCCHCCHGRELMDAARVMGDTGLFSLMEAASGKIRRDIVFAASLHVA